MHSVIMWCPPSSDHAFKQQKPRPMFRRGPKCPYPSTNSHYRPRGIDRLSSCKREAAAMIKLYYHPLSTYSRRVRIALAEKQIAYDAMIVDMAQGKHKEAAYLALNPYHRVPTLEEDGFVLYESTAILNYLEATRSEPPLV